MMPDYQRLRSDRKAAIKYTPSGGQETTLYLSMPLRDLSASPVVRSYQWWSADYTASNTVTVGSGVHDLWATLRFQGYAQELIHMLGEAIKGTTLTYYPDDRYPESYDCTMVNAGDTLAAAQDRDLWHDHRFEVTVRLRRTSGDWRQLITGGALTYYAGANLTAWTFSRASSATQYNQRA